MDLANKNKWASSDGRTFKLLSPDLETDRQFAYAEVKVVKALNQGERLSINGIANANIIDRMAERLDPRGLDVTDYMKNSVLLAHHSYHHPIGQVDAIEIQDDGVHFSAWIGDPSKSELTPMQKEIRSLVAQGILKTVSVGFIPKKVKAPLFDSQGIMTEPCVIESWELLELSVVAVPCNQDSVFQMRSLEVEKKSAIIVNEQPPELSLNANDTKKGLEAVLDENMVVQSLLFDKDIFTLDQIKEWAENNGYKFDAVIEDETQYKCVQRDDKDFDTDSLREVNITEGVNAVVGKTKTVDGKAPGDTAPADGPDMGVVCQQLLEGQKQLLAMCELMVKKLEADAAEDVAEEPASGAPVKPEAPIEPSKALDDRISKLEKGFDKLINSVSLIADKLSK
jgi:HK97 family phage prohead protease